MSTSEEFHHLKVDLKDIASATNDFDPEKLIGGGGFGAVYKGELTLPQGRTTMAFKRLNPKFGQGKDEFWKEIIMLSKYRHENLVSLLCFCDEGDEKILGYEFVSRGSLDHYLSDASLTWTQRIKICIGVGRALNYLHDPKESQERVLHRDIKSSNILLDENWTAKVSDFGLSKFGPANQPQTHVFSKVVGTPGYWDPLYHEMGFLTKESDIYSFGVILFEVMCGRSCYEFDKGELIDILVNMWKHCCDENRPEDIVCSTLEKQIELESLKIFSAVASRCLNRNRKERPTTLEIINELEVALEIQNSSESNRYLVELGRLAEPPLSYESQEELLFRLSQGFRYKDTTWLSINGKGRVCEMISARRCITSLETRDLHVTRTVKSRFDDVIEVALDFLIEVKSGFLVPHITYTINLIFTIKKWNFDEKMNRGVCVPFKYRLDGDTHYSRPFITELRKDGWLKAQLHQFICHENQQHFQIECIRLLPVGYLIIEGIEFRPVEYEMEEENKGNTESTSTTTDINWKQNLPTDNIDLLKSSKKSIQATTKKETDFLLRQNFSLKNEFEHLKIRLEAIMSATNNFADDNCIGKGGRGKVYKGELDHSKGQSVVAMKRLDHAFGQGNFEFWKEILMLSSYRHENIVSLLGFCDESGEKILVYEYASKRSLDMFLKKSDLTWIRRLKICIGAARGLAYLHNPAGTKQRVLHRDIKSSNILLDENWNAKISNLGLSKIGPANQQHSFLVSDVIGTFGYCDPLYAETGILTKESDVYSFGVVLFEILCGRLCLDDTTGNHRLLTELVRQCYEQKKMDEIIYGDIKDKIDPSSLEAFMSISYQCLKRDREERPTMDMIVNRLEVALEFQLMSSLELFDHHKVHLNDIKSATDNFGHNYIIGHGQYGPVYKGELSLPQGRPMMAFKRLDSRFGQGSDELLKEIIKLSKYRHENLVSLLCFCDEGDERILGYEYASRGSLDRYLSDPSLTWAQRIKICIGVARALNYLHDPKETQERVLHQDIKSSNILLDENWTAKVSDLGLSKFGPINQPQSYILSNVVGTPGYCDPLYLEMGLLTKESDIYSFGVVLFELMCGRLCWEYSNGQFSILVNRWKKCFDENKLDAIVCSDLKEQIEPESLKIFSAVASRCLNMNRKERPTTLEIINELEAALVKQNFPHSNGDLIKLSRLAEPPLSYESQEELFFLLSSGFLYKDTTWLSVDKNERVCEIISALKCITAIHHKITDFLVVWTTESRFDHAIMSNTNGCEFRIEASSQFLEPHITYIINLIYKLDNSDHETFAPFKCKLDKETEFSGPLIAELREDGWSSTQLHKFTCNQSAQCFIIECACLKSVGNQFFEGIEFRQVEYDANLGESS